jgi:hypothetical protein
LQDNVFVALPLDDGDPQVALSAALLRPDRLQDHEKQAYCSYRLPPMSLEQRTDHLKPPKSP